MYNIIYNGRNRREYIHFPAFFQSSCVLILLSNRVHITHTSDGVCRGRENRKNSRQDRYNMYTYRKVVHPIVDVVVVVVVVVGYCYFPRVSYIVREYSEKKPSHNRSRTYCIVYVYNIRSIKIKNKPSIFISYRVVREARGRTPRVLI